MKGGAESGGVRWTIEPVADAFASLRAECDGWDLAIAESADDRVLGLVSVAIRWAHVGDRSRRVCYVTSLQVLPEFRKQGIGDALCKRAVDLCRQAGGDSVPILLVIRSGNAAMRGRVQGPRGLPALTWFARAHVSSIAVGRAAAMPVEPGLDVRAACPDDLSEMAAFSSAIAAGRQFAPDFERDRLARWIEGAPGLALSDHLIARSRGRIVGWMGWWDERPVRVVRIAGFSVSARIRRAVQGVTARLAGASPPAAVGLAVRSVRAVNACVPSSRPDVLRALIAEGARRHAHECNWLTVALDERDGAGAALRGLGRRVAEFDAHVTCPAGKYDSLLTDRPLHLEPALL